MSRMSALWTAGAVALLFALIVGAVLLRPVLSVNADGPGSNSQITISAPRQDGSVMTEDSPLQLEDTGIDSDRVIDDEHEDGDHENEHEADD